jgi:hypothetical protein
MSGEAPYSLEDFLTESGIESSPDSAQRDRINDALEDLNSELYGTGVGGGGGGDGGGASDGPHSSAPSDLQSVLSGMDGDGSEGNPYIITNDHELQAMNADLDGHYKLGQNIDATKTGQWNGGEGFDPVGDHPKSNGFKGSLDGNGRYIDGLTIARNEPRVGLFGKAYKPASIKNVFVKNVNVSGDDRVGGICGAMWDFTSITKCVVSGKVQGAENIGGLAGVMRGDEISKSCVSASVKGSKRIGGLVGNLKFSGYGINECYATGKVTSTDGFRGIVGGLAGRCYSSISNSYATGEVTAKNDGPWVGGLAGETKNLNSANGSVEDSYFDEDTTGQKDAVGQGQGTNVGVLGTEQMQGNSPTPSADDTMSELDFGNVWETVTSPPGYPVLQALGRQDQLGARD